MYQNLSPKNIHMYISCTSCSSASREHDKNPKLFFQTLYKLKDEGLDFRLVVMGESYSEVPGK